jgi:TRAP transporter TAXI family solute receptor
MDASAQTGPYPIAKPPYGIAAKRPLFGGACMHCPWGVLGIATTEALKPYGYDVQMCWLCQSNRGPRFMADKTKPTPMEPYDQRRPNLPPVPDGILDLSATSEVNLMDAWNGKGAYAKDGKKRQNYRIVAALQIPNYYLAAVRTDSGIKSLAEIKDRKWPTWVVTDGNEISDQILAYYGIDEEELRKKGGGFIGHNPTRELRAAADVFIHAAVLANTPEQRVWYEATQLSDLTFLEFDDKLLDELAKRPGFTRITAPALGMRGLDKRIDTITRPVHVIYVRDDSPDDFVYTLAKALDEQQHVFRHQSEPIYYDSRLVGKTLLIPLHPAAERYYRERGYLK